MQWERMRKRETERKESKQETLLETDKEDRDEETAGGEGEIERYRDREGMV